MAGNTAILAIKIYGDGQDASRALNQVQTDVVQTDAVTKKSGKSMAGVWTVVAGAMLGVVKASSMTESATVALNTIFGEQGDEMLVWAEGMAQYGLSTAQAGAAAAVLGAQLKNAGFSAEQMTVITQGLIETASALSVVLGGSAVEAAQAMGAALRGEYDSLERYGITLTADAVAAEMLRLSEEGLTFASEQQAKAVATLSLIQQGATNVLADAEAGTVTMQTATDHLFASTKNLAGIIGGYLTPILGPLIENLATTMDKLSGAAKESELLADIQTALGNVLSAVAEILDPIVAEALGLITSLAEALWEILEPFLVPILEALAWTLDLVADALSVVIGFVNSAIEAFERFIEIVREAIDTLTFWNDSYQASAPPTTLMAPAPGVARYGYAAAPYAAGTRQPVTINIQMGVGDPHAVAREIRRVLRLDAARMGRQSTALVA